MQEWLSEEMDLSAQPRGLEEEGFARGFRSVAGLDEVGRGPLAGPVVAAAVVFPRGFGHPEIKDSKLLTPKKREVLASWIKRNALAWGIGVVGPEEIDRINILQASLLAMACAFKELEPAPDYLLIDGSQEIPHVYLKQNPEFRTNGTPSNTGPCLPTFDSPLPAQKAVKHGDRLCLSIAAASIVAKVRRDQLMVEYDRRYPQYGFAGHKGYGSRSHLDALARYGASAIHRRSFRQVREHSQSVDGEQQAAFSFGRVLADG